MKKIKNLQNSVEIIQKYIEKGGLSLFCGAGISLNSGIHLVLPLVEKILIQLNCTKDDANSFLNNGNLPIPFESIIQELKENLHFKEDTKFLNQFAKLFDAKPNPSHYLIAELLSKNLIKNIVTTNFDTCLEQALKDIKKKKDTIITYNENETVLKGLNYDDKIIKIHGCKTNPLLLGTTVDQITKTEFFTKNRLSIGSIIDNCSAILFIGYSCSDKWDVTRIFKEYSKKRKKPIVLYWQHSLKSNQEPDCNQLEMLSSFDCIWMNGDTKLLISEIARRNSIDITNSHITCPKYVLEKLTPMYPDYVLGKLFQASQFYEASARYLLKFLHDKTIISLDNLILKKATESLADVFRKTNKYKNSKKSYLNSIHFLDASKIKNRDYVFYKSGIYTKLGALLRDNENLNEAQNYHQKAMTLLNPYENKEIEIPYKAQIAESYNDFAYLKYELKDLENAEIFWKRSLKIRKEISQVYPQRYLHDCAASLNNLGVLFHYTKRYEKAIEFCSDAVELTRTLTKDNPFIYKGDLAKRLSNLGCLYRDNNETKIALQHLEETLIIRRELAEDSPDVYRPLIANTLINISVLYQKTINKELSILFLDKAVTILVEFKETPSVMKYIEIVKRVLKDWGIDYVKYLINYNIKIDEIK